MTLEEIKAYTEQNEPIEIKRDEVGRWIERVWENGITETYTYQWPADILLNNKDITKYRDSYKVLSSELKGGLNG